MEQFLSGLTAGLFLAVVVGIACYLWGSTQVHTRNDGDVPRSRVMGQRETAEPQTGLDIWRDLGRHLRDMERKGHHLP